MRLDFPHFDGDNPSAWTYKVNQFFDYYQTPLYQSIRMASFHLERESLIWFQDADEAGQLPTWDLFIQALLVWFGPAYDDPMESLVKLRHSSTVAEYTSQFVSLSNHLRGLSKKKIQAQLFPQWTQGRDLPSSLDAHSPGFGVCFRVGQTNKFQETVPGYF